MQIHIHVAKHSCHSVVVAFQGKSGSRLVCIPVKDTVIWIIILSAAMAMFDGGENDMGLHELCSMCVDAEDRFTPQYRDVLTDR